MVSCTGRWPAWALACLVAGCVTAGPAMGQMPDWSPPARQRLPTAGAPAVGGSVDLRRQRLDAGEQPLSLVDVQAARQAFDRAAMMLHAPVTEAALVRTHMQAGECRQALAFGAHAAGAHLRKWPAGTALHAWLLQVGGQGVVGRRMLDEARVGSGARRCSAAGGPGASGAALAAAQQPTAGAALAAGAVGRGRGGAAGCPGGWQRAAAGVWNSGACPCGLAAHRHASA